jgi:hypothetical protein
MADIVLTLQFGDHSYSRAAAIDDGLMPMFFDTYRRSYGQIADGVDADGKPLMRDRTDEEVFAAYAHGIADGTIANVVSHVRELRIAQALAGAPKIEITPKD